MNLYKHMHSQWRKLSITYKFGLCFGLLLGLIFLVSICGHAALTILRDQTESAILTSTEIQRLVLEMDGSLEEARRRQRDFFLRYPQIGFKGARDKFAIRASAEITKVVHLCEKLKNLVMSPDVSEELRKSVVYLNLYHSSSERYGRTFMEAVELVTRLAAEETGAAPRLEKNASLLNETLATIDSPELIGRFNKMRVFEKGYFVTHHRSKMHSVYNASIHLSAAIFDAPLIPEELRNRAISRLEAYGSAARQVVELDTEIRRKLVDFDLQAESMDPISANLRALAGKEVERARDRIVRTGRTASILLIVIAIAGSSLVMIVARILNDCITNNIVRITTTARRLRDGALDARIRISCEDELGQLAEAFNAMAAEIKDKMHVLDEKNMQLKASNTKQERLVDNLTLFRSAVAASTDAVGMSTAEGLHYYQNEAFDRLFGDIGDDPPSTLYADQTVGREVFDAIMAGKTWIGEVRMYGADGGILDILLRAYAIKDEEGRVVNLIGVHTDITERKRAEAALNVSEARYRTLVENAPEAIAVIDLETGLFIDVNTNAETLYGLTREELLQSDPADTSPPNQPDGRPSREAAMDFILKAFEGETQTFEWTHLNLKTGKEVFCEVRLVRLPASGRNLVRGSVVDITRRKQREAELHSLRNYLSNIIDSMPSVLIGVDADGAVTQWNKTAENATGVAADAARGKTLSRVFPRMASEMEKIAESIRTRKTKQDRKRPRMMNDGELRHEDVTIYPLIANGVEGAVIRIDDVTDRARMEEMMIQSEKMLSVGGLAAGMAHEINNPLAGILQNVQVIKNRVSTDLPVNRRAAEEFGLSMEAIRAYMEKRGVLKMMEAVSDSGRRAARIVNNMLSFSRKSESNFAPRSMETLLDQTIELAENDYDLKKKYDFRKIEIVREYDDGIPEALCEGSKIQQVFLNILKNGAQAMCDANTPAPRFTCRVSPDGEMVRVEIEDNGPGMGEATRKRVFEPFFTTKGVKVGTGLGLSVSYFIITENHGGSMTVESDPGRGSTFIIRLPVKRNTHGA